MKYIPQQYNRYFLIISIFIAINAAATVYIGVHYYRAYMAEKVELGDESLKSYSFLGTKINALNHRRFQLIASLIILLTLCCMLFFKSHTGDSRRLWITSSIYSTLIALAICYIWKNELHYQKVKKEGYIIEDTQDLKNFLNDAKNKNPQLFGDKHHIVPVGFLLYVIDIKDNYESTIESYVWARYDPKTDSKIIEPIRTANNEQILTLNKAERANGITLVWNTVSKSAQQFDLTKYPFDQQKISFVFYHPNFIEDVILVPDLDSYTKPDKSLFPVEIRQDVRIRDFTIDSAYFFYILTDYSTNFGVNHNLQQKNFPYLMFGIEIHRHLINPLISTLLPIITILLILFFILLILARLRNRGIALTSVMGLLSGLFFAAIIAEQTFDRTIETSSITYFKTFYYLTYIAIFIVAIDCLMFLLDHNKLIKYGNNFYARLLFWPIISSMFFIVTFIFFYNLS